MWNNLKLHEMNVCIITFTHLHIFEFLDALIWGHAAVILLLLLLLFKYDIGATLSWYDRDLNL